MPRGFLGAPEEARGLVHDVFERLWRHRGEWQPEEGSARAYLYRAARSRALDALNHRRVRERHADERRHTGHALRTAGLLRPGEAAPPDAHLEEEELRSAIQRAVEDLPPRQREAFRLTNRQGLSYKEAAQVMGVATGTVAVHVHEALKSLRNAVNALRPSSSFDPRSL